jgi:hypothetical protein
MDESEIDEFAIGDNDALPFRWVRYSRLKHPKGPFNESWLFDQVVQNRVRSVILLPRDKVRGVRLVDLQSLLSLLEQLAAAPGQDSR